MDYIRVKWLHANAAYPIWLYSELDSERRETRKVEIWADGRVGYASSADGGIETVDTRLGELPVPLLEEIAKDPEFEPLEISRQEFEQVWSRRCS